MPVDCSSSVVRCMRTSSTWFKCARVGPSEASSSSTICHCEVPVAISVCRDTEIHSAATRLSSECLCPAYYVRIYGTIPCVPILFPFLTCATQTFTHCTQVLTTSTYWLIFACLLHFLKVNTKIIMKVKQMHYSKWVYPYKILFEWESVKHLKSACLFVGTGVPFFLHCYLNTKPGAQLKILLRIYAKLRYNKYRIWEFCELMEYRRSKPVKFYSYEHTS